MRLARGVACVGTILGLRRRGGTAGGNDGGVSSSRARRRWLRSQAGGGRRPGPESPVRCSPWGREQGTKPLDRLRVGRQQVTATAMSASDTSRRNGSRGTRRMSHPSNRWFSGAPIASRSSRAATDLARLSDAASRLRRTRLGISTIATTGAVMDSSAPGTLIRGFLPLFGGFLPLFDRRVWYGRRLRADPHVLVRDYLRPAAKSTWPSQLRRTPWNGFLGIHGCGTPGSHDVS
jgi:hypothetical protein